MQEDPSHHHHAGHARARGDAHTRSTHDHDAGKAHGSHDHGAVVFSDGGWPFLKGLFRELADRRPGVMTLSTVIVAINSKRLERARRLVASSVTTHGDVSAPAR